MAHGEFMWPSESHMCSEKPVRKNEFTADEECDKRLQLAVDVACSWTLPPEGIAPT